MHYKRLKKHGHPLGGGVMRGPDGEIESFLAATLASDTDECILWPFGKDKDGYGRLRRKGKSFGAHIYVCTKVHGPRPNKDDACHSCGNGHLSCITPKHLRWGTRLDNINDSIEHGTDNFFGRGPSNKLAA